MHESNGYLTFKLQRGSNAVRKQSSLSPSCRTVSIVLLPLGNVAMAGVGKRGKPASRAARARDTYGRGVASSRLPASETSRRMAAIGVPQPPYLSYHRRNQIESTIPPSLEGDLLK